MKLLWARQAVTDLDRIWLFLADRNLAYADKVEARLKQRARTLIDFPMLGRAVRGRDLRELSVPDTQHVIVYRIEDGLIRIMRIWSTAQQRGASA